MPAPFKDTKTGMFKLRLRVPKEIQHIVGKKLVIKTLETKDAQLAKLRFAAEYKSVQELFSESRRRLDEDHSATITPLDIQILADRWVDQTLLELELSGDFSRWLVLYGDGTVAPFYSEDDRTPVEESYERQLERIGSDLDSFLSKHGVVVAHSCDNYRALVEAFTEGTMKLASLCEDRYHGTWTSAHKGIQARQLSVGRPKDSKPKISAVLDDLITEENLTHEKNYALKHLGEYRTNLRQFIEACGDRPIDQYTKRDVLEYRTLMLQLPAGKADDIRSKTIHQQIEIAESLSLKRLSQSTVKKRLRFLGSLFTFAVERELIEKNPTHGTTTKLNTDAKNFVSGYTKSEIEKIFSSSIFTDGLSSTNTPFGVATYWAPLIAYYTGARIEEICQLYADDVLLEDDIWFFHFTNARADQNIKNGKARKVPVHKDLLQLGLIEYAQSLPSGGLLFPALSADIFGNYSTRLSDWLRVYLREKVGVSPNVQPLHGFRHTFKTLCRSAQIPEEWHDAFTGHGGKSIGRGYGQYQFKDAFEIINKLPGVVFKNLLPYTNRNQTA